MILFYENWAVFCSNRGQDDLQKPLTEVNDRSAKTEAKTTWSPTGGRVQLKF